MNDEIAVFEKYFGKQNAEWKAVARTIRESTIKSKEAELARWETF